MRPSGILKHGKINSGCGWFAKVEKPSVAGHSDDFEILECGHKANADVLTESAAIGKQDFRETTAEDGNTRMLRSIVGIEIAAANQRDPRSEEHTSELQSPDHLVCRLLLEKKKEIDYFNSFIFLH